MAIKGDPKQVGLYLSGAPIPVPDCNIILTQPKVRDVVMFGEDEFLVITNIFAHPENLTKEVREGNSQLGMLPDFQLLMMIFKNEPLIKSSVDKLFDLIFPDYEIKFDDSSILFLIEAEEGKKKPCGRITPFNFENLSNIINDLFEPQNDQDKDYNPANSKAAEIAEKIKRGRERVARQKGEDGAHSLFGRYTSILAIGMQMDVNVFYNYTPFQLYDAFNRYFAKVSSDFYSKVATTPLMDVSKMEEPDEWFRVLYK